MPLALSILLLAGLFLVLSLSADQVAKNARTLAIKLGLPIFVLGLILGLLTSFPEGAIAINAVINNVPGLSLGNLIGGTIVMLSLILGVGVVLHKEIDNDGRLGFLALCLGYLLLPLFLAMRGTMNYVDGALLIILYFFLMGRLYHSRHQLPGIKMSIVSEAKIMREVGIVIAGVILILLSSHFIIDITTELLRRYELSPFIVGLLFFPLGTNLPELTVAIASWRRKEKELSFSNLLGSSVSNILMLGILVTIRPFNFNINYNFFVTLTALIVLITSIIFFYRSGRKLTRWEGFVLIGIYILFILMQFRSGPLNL